MLSKEEIISQSREYKNYTGVYFLIKNDRIVYIGSSFRINKRLMTQYGGGIKFDSSSFVEVNTKNRLRLQEVEAEYILKYKPCYNKSIPENSKYVLINNGLPKELLAINNIFKIKLLKKNGFELVEYENSRNGWGSSISHYYNSKMRRKLRLCLIKNFNILEKTQQKYIELKKQINTL